MPFVDPRFAPPIPRGLEARQLWEQSIQPPQAGDVRLPFAPNVDWGMLAKAMMNTINLFSQPDLMNPLMFAGPKATGFAKATGKFSSMADKMERFEIIDKESIYHGKRFGPGSSVKLPKILEHPTIYDEYPELRNVNVYLDPNMSESGSLVGTNAIKIKTGIFQHPKKTLIHEIQHWIQEKEGFARGGNPEQVYMKFYKEAQENNQYASNTELSSIASKKAHEYYRRLAGEIESRDIAARMGLTQEQRLTTPPYSSENIPLSDWIIRMQK